MVGGSVTDVPVRVLVSPFRLHGGPIEWRGWCVLWCPVFGLGPPLYVVPRFVLSRFTLCVVVLGSAVVVGLFAIAQCGGGGLLRVELCPALLSYLPRLCVCCHSIVGLVPCVCDMVASLWNGGDSLCVGRKGVWVVWCGVVS